MGRSESWGYVATGIPSDVAAFGFPLLLSFLREKHPSINRSMISLVYVYGYYYGYYRGLYGSSTQYCSPFWQSDDANQSLKKVTKQKSQWGQYSEI